MVLGLRPRTHRIFPYGNGHRLPANHHLTDTDLREPVEDTLCPSGRACPACVKRLRTHRVRGATVWRGQASRFAPLPSACRAGRAADRPGDLTSPRRSKVFPSLAGFSFNDSCRLRSSLPWPRPSSSPEPFVQPASQTAGKSPQCLTARRVRRRFVLAPCTEMYDYVCRSEVQLCGREKKFGQVRFTRETGHRSRHRRGRPCRLTRSPRRRVAAST